MELNLQNIDFSYGQQKVLHDVSFNLPSGQISLLLGPNGAGKSTLNLLLAGILFPDSGMIRFGQDTLKTDQRLPYSVGFLGDRELIPADQTVAKILKLIARLKGIIDSDNAIAKCVNELELESVLNKKFGELSLGFRQRVTLAQALLGDPQLLLLDEPGNGLDPRQFKDLENILIRLKQNRIILVSTHRVREAHGLADRVIMLNQGKLVTQGKVSELLLGSGEIQWSIQLHEQRLSAEHPYAQQSHGQWSLNPQDPKELSLFLELIGKDPKILKSINSSEMDLEQLFMQHLSAKEIHES